MACSTCNALIEKYESLKNNLSDILGKVSECNSVTVLVKDKFSEVIMNGNSIGSDEISSIYNNLSSIKSNLDTLISECDNKINSIKSSCPGLNHYNKTINTTVDDSASEIKSN